MKSTDYFTPHCCSKEISSYRNTGENNAEKERERESACVRESVCKRVREKERESVCVCERVRERVCVRESVCERENVCVYVRERVCVRERMCVCM